MSELGAMMPGLASIVRLWQEHLSTPFPNGLAGKEVEGEGLVMLEADIAGCLVTFLGGNRAPALDPKRLEILHECATSLSRICPKLPIEHRAYFDRLRAIAEDVVSLCRRNSR